MNNSIILITVIVFLGVFTNCSVWIPGGMVDSTTPVPPEKYQVLGEANGEESSTKFLIFEFNKPNKDFIEKATEKAIKSMNGDALINVYWYHKYTNYFLFSTYSFIVRGTVIKTSGIDQPKFNQLAQKQPLVSKQPKKINWMNFFTDLEIQVSTAWGSRELTEGSVGGFNSFAFNVFTRNRSRFIYFYPQVSYTRLVKKRDKKIQDNYGNTWIFDQRNFIRSIPITFNVGINFGQFENISKNLPDRINPYANFGVGYYITQIGYIGSYADWEWKNLGYRLGIGVAYQISPSLSLTAGFNRNSVLTGTNYSFWELGIGLAYLFRNN